MDFDVLRSTTEEMAATFFPSRVFHLPCSSVWAMPVDSKIEEVNVKPTAFDVAAEADLRDSAEDGDLEPEIVDHFSMAISSRR